AHGPNAMSQRAVYDWYIRFKNVRSDVEDDPRSGRPKEARTELNIELIQGLLNINRHWTCEEMAELSGIPSSSTLELGPLLLHDNASSHTAHIVQNLLRDYQWEVLPHPPYSPDLSPCNFDLFPKLKNQLRGRRFHCLDDLFSEVGRIAKDL
uniref:DDE_3 domain-containing protein n=1 Tax=Macrostomum lignano TaxID=282301 RepID=A0A1I8G015_9PLAT